MVEHYLAKVNTRVRFPPLAPSEKQSRFARDFLFFKEKEGLFAGLLLFFYKMFNPKEKRRIE